MREVRERGLTEERRASPRASLFQLASMRKLNNTQPCSLRIRNLSPRGVLGETSERVAPGEKVTFIIPGIGEVSGTIVWRTGERFGAAFARKIDPDRATRAQAAKSKPGSVLAKIRLIFSRRKL